MLYGACPWRSERDLAAIGLGMINEFFDRFCRRRIRHHDYVCEGSKACNGGKVCDRIIANGREEVRVRCEEARADEEGVTIRSGLRGCLRSSVATRTALILNDHLLAPDFGQSVGKHPS